MFHSERRDYLCNGERVEMLRAIKNGDTETIEKLINSDLIDINANVHIWNFIEYGVGFVDSYISYSALHYAAKCGNLASIKTLVELGADVTAIDSNWKTPLQVALDNDNKSAADYFKEDYSAIDQDGKTPLLQVAVDNPATDYFKKDYSTIDQDRTKVSTVVRKHEEKIKMIGNKKLPKGPPLLADSLQTVKKEVEKKSDSQAFRIQRKELQYMKRDTNQSLSRLKKDTNTELKSVKVESEQRVQELQHRLQNQNRLLEALEAKVQGLNKMDNQNKVEIQSLKEMLQNQERKSQLFYSRLGWLCTFLLVFCFGCVFSIIMYY